MHYPQPLLLHGGTQSLLRLDGRSRYNLVSMCCRDRDTRALALACPDLLYMAPLHLPRHIPVDLMLGVLSFSDL